MPTQTRRRERMQSGAMHGRQMVALEEILDQALPVRLPFLVAGKNHTHVLDVHVPDHGFERTHGFRFGKRLRPRAQVDEDKSVPGFAGETRQPAFAQEIIVAFVDFGRAHERTVEIVSPGMVGAGELLRVAGALRDRHRTVSADIGHRDDTIGSAAHDEQRFAHQFRGHVVADVRDFLLAPEADPFHAKQLFALDFEKFGAGIKGSRHRKRVCRVRVHDPVEKTEEIVHFGRHGTSCLTTPYRPCARAPR